MWIQYKTFRTKHMSEFLHSVVLMFAQGTNKLFHVTYN